MKLRDAGKVFAVGLAAKVGAVAVTLALLFAMVWLERQFLAHASPATVEVYRRYDAAIDLTLIGAVLGGGVLVSRRLRRR